MNRSHAREAALVVARNRVGQTYEQLRELIGRDHEYHQIELEGVRYQVTLDVFWDDEPEGLLRVWLAVDDCGLRAFFPLVFCDLLAPREVFSADLA